jgi:hypothetical protein
MNSSLGNNCFEKKKETCEKKTFNLTKNIVKEFNEWNKKNIKTRGKNLLNYIKQIWPKL